MCVVSPARGGRRVRTLVDGNRKWSVKHVSMDANEHAIQTRTQKINQHTIANDLVVAD